MALDRPDTLNSLGFARAPADTRVVVAMSGGVDSSVVAAKLAEEGYDVVGVTLQLYDHGAALAKKGACCAGRDIHDARRVAEEMGFPHYVLDYENTFREAVIDEFADSYLAGATPVPCIRCNERVKFKDLLETAKDLDADCMATGHYIQRRMGPTKAELHCAADAARDQSYFLFPPRRNSSISCASRWATSPPRPKPARLPRNTGFRWPTSRTARTSASCPTGITPP
jgi:tRNA-specific 2-thiouridylase